VNATILVVEDEADLLYLVRTGLETDGHQVLSASSAEEALSVLGREKPDAMVLNLLLPGMGGLELLRLVRGQGGRLGSLPVIVMSAHASRKTKQAARELGVTVYVVKPFALHALRDAVGAAVAQTLPEPT
jgi:DNA-binding response OmpR family regulator